MCTYIKIQAAFSMDSATYFVMKQNFFEKTKKLLLATKRKKEMYSSCSFFKNDLFSLFLLQTI